jgi:hypothetical protein
VSQRALATELSTVAGLTATRLGVTIVMTVGGTIIGGMTGTTTMPSRAGRV